MNEKNALRIFDSFAITDTGVKYPDDIAGWKDTEGVKKIAFGIENDLNQDVSVQPIGRAGGALGNLGSPTTVTKHSTGIVCLNLNDYWAPYLSVSLTCSVAPLAGQITVNLIWR